jgi:hypothetical protein
MKRTVFVGAMIVSVVLSGCASASQDDNPEPASSNSTVATPPPAPSEGPVAEYLETFDADHFGGITLPRTIVTERARPHADAEDGFIAAVREDPAQQEATSVFTRLDDASVLYLGYLYCAAFDVSNEIAPSIATVVDVVARSNGRPSTKPADEDFIATVTIVNHSSGSLCPELYVDTRDFLDEFLGSQ